MISKLLCSTACIYGLAAAPALADDVAASPAGQIAAAESGEGMNDIIVTANKRAQNLQDAPVAVTPVSEAQLKSLNIVSISEITRIVPSLNFVPAPSPATTMFVIRGVGTFAFNDALEQSVGLVVDGVPMARLVGSISDAVDLERVQVLRGPQGTIFGKNATAGVISLDYREPTNETSFDGRVFLGTYSERNFQGTFNLPLIKDKLAVRLSGWNFSRGGYIDAPFQPKGDIGGYRNIGGRAKVAITPTDNLTIDLTSEYRRDRVYGSVQTARGYILNPTTGLPQSALEAAIRSIDIAQGITAGPDNLLTDKDYPETTGIRQFREVAKGVLDIGDNSLTAIVGYVDTYTSSFTDTDYTVSRLPLVQTGVTHYYSTIKQLTSELRFANSSSSKFKYTLGLFYYDVDVDSHQNAQQPLATLPRTAFDTVAKATTKNYAAFADLSYDIGRLTAFAGGRYSHERTQGSFNRFKSVNFPDPAVVGGGGLLSVTSQPIKYDDFSYRAGLQYHATDEIMLYGSASRAYKGPGLNFGPTLTAAQFAFNGAQVGAEIAHSYEAGIRSQLWDRQLTLNLTGFYAPFTNFQVTTVLPTIPTSFSTVNAPKLLSKGIELEFALVPRNVLPGVRLDGNVVYNDTKYDDFKNAPCFAGQVVSPTATLDPGICSSRGGANVVNVSGLRALGAPEWQVNLTGGYEREIGSLRAFGQAHYLFNSDTQYAVSNNPQTVQKAYSTVDLTAGIGASDRRWTLSLYVRNLTDKRFATRIAISNPTITQSIPFAAVRSGGASLDVSF